MVMANLKNFKQLSLIAYIANFMVLLALTSVYVDGIYTMTFREAPLEIKYFDYRGIPTFIALVG